MSEGQRLTELTLSAAGNVTGIFTPTDVMAVGALEAIARQGLDCPGDVSVIGYNDIPLIDHVAPPLSTIGLPSQAVGDIAAGLALRHMRDPSLPTESIQLPATLIERQSTGRPPTS